MIIIFALWTTGFATAGQQPQKSPGSFEVPRSDLTNAEALANQLTALSPRVDRQEATLLADCAYATINQLRRQYRMFGTPIFNNFLIYHGLRKRGYCYQWTADLLVALDALKLKTLELHWGESYAGTWRENNCLVVTAKGQPFERGMMLECWRHMGHLNSHLLLSDEDRYFENKKYAQFVLETSATGDARHETRPSDQRNSGSNHHVAFQKSMAAKEKAGE
ncbi:MAG: hypothetical protein DME33_14175 [Verrucomicrobia bacterium]|nr:MAG: hypothetical protein DME33_14175 [Verrucomicrobiota bacterium]